MPNGNDQGQKKFCSSCGKTVVPFSIRIAVPAPLSEMRLGGKNFLQEARLDVHKCRECGLLYHFEEPESEKDSDGDGHDPFLDDS